MVCAALLILLQASDTLATVRVRPTLHGEAAVGARVRADTVERSAGSDGMAILRLAPGTRTVVVRAIGQEPVSRTLQLRAGQDTTVEVALGEGVELEAIVATTRSERRVEDTPVRVEVIDDEEIAEKVAMTPGDIAMMMNETSGLRVASTSPSLGGSAVRIQGLRGRYTLMLSDGLPLYASQGGGFGLMQIPPLDLGRVEVIKGGASALYGPAALGGVINLISRTPGDEPLHELLLNQTSRGGTDAVFFASGPAHGIPHVGTTGLISAHRQSRQDIDGDGWADMSAYERIVVRPRIFIGGPSRSMFITAGYTGEDRTGGTMPGRVAPDGQPWIEALRTNRSDAGLSARLLRGANVVSVRVSAVEQRHDHQFDARHERDRHSTIFSEATLAVPRDRWTMVIGSGFQHERYRNRDVNTFDFRYDVPTAFAQLDVDATRALVLSGSVRGDEHSHFGTMVSSRASAMLRLAPVEAIGQWTARVSATRGPFVPVPFVDESDAVGLAALQLSLGPLTLERARGISFDVNGTLERGFGTLELNASAYRSMIENPVIASIPDEPNPSTPVESLPIMVRNSPIPTRTWGAEVLARASSGALRVTASYAYLRAMESDDSDAGVFPSPVQLAPRHSAGMVASIEREGRDRVGLEAYYVGKQVLEEFGYRASSPPYIIIGMLGERTVQLLGKPTRVFVNAENIGNVRQTRYDPLVRQSRAPGGRWTTDAWTELSGFTVNGGVRFSF